MNNENSQEPSYSPLNTTPVDSSTQDSSTASPHETTTNEIDDNDNDNESIMSDISDTPITHEMSAQSIEEFLEDTKHSRKFIEQPVHYSTQTWKPSQKTYNDTAQTNHCQPQRKHEFTKW